MIEDYELELTTAGGQAITATAYGTKKVDQKGVAEAAIGDQLSLCFQVVTADFNTLTSIDVSLKADDDGAGTNEVDLVTKNFLLAALTTAKGVRRIMVPPIGTEKRFMRVKFTVNGSAPSQGAMVAWLQKGHDRIPYNDGVKIGSV